MNIDGYEADKLVKKNFSFFHLLKTGLVELTKTAFESAKDQIEDSWWLDLICAAIITSIIGTYTWLIRARQVLPLFPSSAVVLWMVSPIGIALLLILIIGAYHTGVDYYSLQLMRDEPEKHANDKLGKLIEKYAPTSDANKKGE